MNDNMLPIMWRDAWGNRQIAEHAANIGKHGPEAVYFPTPDVILKWYASNADLRVFKYELFMDGEFVRDARTRLPAQFDTPEEAMVYWRANRRVAA